MKNLTLKLISAFALSALSFGAYADDLTYTTYTVSEDGTLSAKTVTISEGDYEDFEGSTSNTLTNPAELNYTIYNAYNTAGNIEDVGGAALRYTSTDELVVTGSFIECYFSRTGKGTAAGGGGAVYNTGTLTINGDFVGNYTTGGNGASVNFGGGAVYNEGTLTVNGDFIDNLGSGNSNGGGGAIRNAAEGTMYITGNFISNTSSGSNATGNIGGGAIYNLGVAYISGSFINNFAEATNNAVSGGAIYNTGTVYMQAKESSIFFTGNTIDTNTTTDSNIATTTDITLASNAIYNTGTINFEATGDYKIVVNDAIDGTTAGKLNISSGTTYFNNTVANQTIAVSSGATLALGAYAGTSDLLGDETYISVAASSAYLSSSALTVESGASLNVAASISLDSSSITLKAGSSISFANDSAINVYLSDIEDSFSVVLFYVEDSDTVDSILETLAVEDFLSLFIDGEEIYADDETYEYALSVYDNTESTGFYEITLSNSAVPEPSTYAMIIGVLALGFAYYRRRK